MRSMKNYIREPLRRGLLLALAAACLFCGGCGNGDGEEAEATPLLPTPSPTPAPQRGGEIRLPMPLNADITDPLQVNTEEMLSFFSLLYESLITIGPDGRLVAELAESWSGDESARVWTVTLRSGVKWHSGADLSAYDVTATFTRLKDLGASSYSAYEADKIESMRALDPLTLEITMKEGGYASLYALTFPIMEGGQPAATPVGTGPFMLESWSGEQVRLVANEAWWKQRPYLDAITFVERDSNDTALASYRAGQLDMVPSSNTSVGSYRDDNTIVLDIMTQTAELLLINNTNANLRDINVRKALACALDRGQIISNIYMNRAQPCDVPIPPDSWVYDSASKVYDYNQARALELFAAAGWEQDPETGELEKDGRALSIRLLVNDSSDTTRREAAGLVADQLTDLGITVEVITAAHTLGETDSDYMQALQTGAYDLCLLGINLGRDCDLTSVMEPGGAAHYGNYSSPELTSLAQDVVSAKNETGYRQAAIAFQKAFVENLPFIVLYFRLNSVVYSSEIQGVTQVREPDIMYGVDQWYILSQD